MNRSDTFGVKLDEKSNYRLLVLQSRHDKWAHSRLLEMLRDKYTEQGHANCTRGRIGKGIPGEPALRTIP